MTKKSKPVLSILDSPENHLRVTAASCIKILYYYYNIVNIVSDASITSNGNIVSSVSGTSIDNIVCITVSFVMLVLKVMLVL